MSLDRVIMLSVHSCPLDILGGINTGGMNAYIRDLSRKLGKKGLRVDIFTRSKNPSVPKIVQMGEGVRVIHIQAGLEEPYHKNLIWNHLHEFIKGVLDFVEGERIRYDVIHSHYWLSGCVARELQREWDIPTVHTSHTLGFQKNRVARSEHEKEPILRLEKESEVLNTVDSIIATTLLEKRQINVELNIPLEKIEVIPCGVDCDLFRPWGSEEAKAHLGLNGQRFILFVGRIDPIKGLDNLIKAMDLLSRGNGHDIDETKLLIIGGQDAEGGQDENGELKNLLNLTSQLDLHNRVEFLGAKRQDLLPYYYSSAEACVLPSRHESFGIVALEAMACGTPVVASHVGGLASIVGDEKTGFVVPEGDYTRLAEKIEWILSDRDLREKMSREAIKSVEKFEWSLIVEQVISFYSQMVS